MKNKIVDAFSDAYGYYNYGFPQLFYPDADKYAVLDGDSSRPSNNEGIASFTNLTILGSSHKNVYILFSIDGSGMITPWGSYNSTILSKYVKTFISPIIIDYGNQFHYVSFIQNPPVTSDEGKEFLIQPILNVIDKISGNSIDKLICFARLAGFNGFNFPSYYNFAKHLFIPKLLTKMITGAYYDCLECPKKSCFVPNSTNSKGYVEFEGLGMTVSGNIIGKASTAKLNFACGNSISEIIEIKITTTVNKIEIQHLINYLEMKNTNKFNYFSLQIEVSDSKGAPISGKVIDSIDFLDTDQAISENIVVDIKHYMGYESLYYYTNLQGIVNLDAEIRIFNASNQAFYIKLSIDGIYNHTYNFAQIFIDGYLSSNCLSLQYDGIISNPINMNITSRENFAFKAIDGKNSLINNYNSYFSLLFSSIVPALILYQDPLVLMYYYSTNSYIYEMKNGILSIKGFTLSQLQTGTYLGYIILQNFAYGSMEVDVCTTFEPFIFEFSNEISRVLFKNPEYNNLLYELEIYPDNKISTSLIALNAKNQAVSNQAISISILVCEFPLIYSFILYKDDTNMFYLTSNSMSTDQTGTFQVEIQYNKKFSGKWIIGLLVNGISSPPISISILNPISSISIISDNSQDSSSPILLPIGNPIFVNAIPDKSWNCSNVPIIAFFKPTNLSLDISFDILDANETNEIWNPIRINWTDSSCIAQFSKLTIFSIDNSNGNSPKEVEGNFYFVLATNFKIRSKNSRIYKFLNKMDDYIKLQPSTQHDNIISLMLKLGKVFSSDIILKFQPDNTTNLFSFRIRISRFESRNVSKRESLYLTDTLLSHTNCNIVNSHRINLNCDVFLTNHPNNNSVFLTINFTGFNLNAKLVDQTFDLVLCFFSFCSFENKAWSRIQISTSNYYIDIQIRLQSVVYIGEKFILWMYVTNSNNKAVIYSLVSCKVRPVSLGNSFANSITQLIDLIANSFDIFDAYNEINKYKGDSELNKNQSFRITDTSGFLSMEVEFLKVYSGFYVIQCSAEGAETQTSNVFYLQNYIEKIIINNDEEFTIKLKFMKKGEKQLASSNITITKKYNLSIQNQTGFIVEGLESDIYVEISNEGFYNYFMNIAQTQNTNSTIDLILNFLKVLVKGSSAIFYTDRNVPDTFRMNFLKSKQFYISTDVNVTVKFPGIYRLRFYSKGIYSDFSKKLTIIDDIFYDFYSFSYNFQTLIFLVSVLLVIIGSSIHFLLWPNLLLGMLICFDIIVYICSNIGSTSMILGLIILFTLLFMIIMLIYRNFNYGMEYNFYNVKKKIFKNYSSIKLKQLIKLYDSKIYSVSHKK